MSSAPRCASPATAGRLLVECWRRKASRLLASSPFNLKSGMRVQGSCARGLSRKLARAPGWNLLATLANEIVGGTTCKAKSWHAMQPSCVKSCPPFVASPSVRAADAAAGTAAYAICAACHGPEGEGNVAMNAPKIAGQEPWYLERHLAAYREGLRGTARGDTYGAQMRPMAMAVANPEAVANLIAHIGTLPVRDSPPTVAGDPGAGRTGYLVCAACHGQAAEGNEQMAGPRLAGQNDWYLVRQIQNYNKGLRGYDPKDIYGNQMRPMAATLATDKAISDVVAYINTLQ